MGMKKPRKT